MVKGDYAFTGQYNDDEHIEPKGFIRVINDNGSITEGIHKEDGKRNGWCITFVGFKNIINWGWYKDNLKNGNFWQFNLKTMEYNHFITGYYEDDKWVEKLKKKSLEYPICDIKDIFQNYGELAPFMKR